MHAIHKYPILIEDHFTIDMPAGAQPLSCHTQHGYPQLWALVERDATATTTRRFRLAGTGHPIQDDEAAKLKFVGTFLLRHDQLVFHLFEVVG
jgi:hypothetical protein